MKYKELKELVKEFCPKNDLTIQHSFDKYDSCELHTSKGIIWIGLDGDFLWFNPQFAHIYQGYRQNKWSHKINIWSNHIEYLKDLLTLSNF